MVSYSDMQYVYQTPFFSKQIIWPTQPNPRPLFSSSWTTHLDWSSFARSEVSCQSTMISSELLPDLLTHVVETSPIASKDVFELAAHLPPWALEPEIEIPSFDRDRMVKARDKLGGKGGLETSSFLNYRLPDSTVEVVSDQFSFSDRAYELLVSLCGKKASEELSNTLTNLLEGLYLCKPEDQRVVKWITESVTAAASGLIETRLEVSISWMGTFLFELQGANLISRKLLEHASAEPGEILLKSRKPAQLSWSPTLSRVLTLFWWGELR